MTSGTIRRWALLSGVWVVYLSFGLIVASLAPLLTPIGEELGLSKSSLGAILGAWPLVFIVASLPCGWLLDRISLRWGLMLGGGLMCLSGIFRAVSYDGLTLFAAVGVFGLGAPLISSGAPKFVMTHFPEHQRPLATGLYMTGPMAGQVIALSLANSVILPLVGGNWRGVLWVIAAASGLCGVFWLTLSLVFASDTRKSLRVGRATGTDEPPIRTTEHDEPALEADVEADTGESNSAAATGVGGVGGADAGAGETSPHNADRLTSLALIRERAMQLVLLMAISVFFVNHGLNNWLPKILEDGGLTPSGAGFIAAASYGAAAAGSFLLPYWGRDENRVWLPVISPLCLAATVAMLAVLSGAAVTPFVLLMGFFRFGMVSLGLVVLMRVPGIDSRNMGIASAMFFSAGEIGGFTGPLAVGVIADASGGFLVSILTLTAAALLQCYLMMLIFRRSAREQGRRLADLQLPCTPPSPPPDAPGHLI